jgi:hypothetical protein
MRKLDIKTKEKNQRRTWALIFLFLMVFSVVGYAIVNSFNNNDSLGEVSDEGFVKTGGYWAYQISDQVYYFSNLPSEVSNLTVEGNFSLADYYNKPLYFTENNKASIEILNNLGRYAQRSQLACISEENCGDDLPIKNCSIDNVIVFTRVEGEVRKEGECVYLGEGSETADRFLYEVLKIN